mgnify:CR=1 FL=1
MTKKEFLNILYEQLSDQMPEAKASAHTQYYHDYIQDALKNGQKEKQVLDSLGDPRLIAKTLIDTDAEPSVFSGTNTSDYYHTENTGYGNQSDSEYGQPKHRHYHLDLSTWYGKLIVIAAAAAVLALLFMVLSFLLPVILVVGVVLFLVSQFRKRR